MQCRAMACHSSSQLRRVSTFNYFGGRYYASKTGRFTTVDPMMDIQQAIVDPQRWNQYAYSLNNPFHYVDPDGLDPLPTALLQFYNAAFRNDFSSVDISSGPVARAV